MRAIWLAVGIAGAGLVTACKDSQKPNENQAPNANFTSNCEFLRCDFTDASTDDGTIVSWNWSFGTDGSIQRDPIYSYPTAGSYQVSLTVKDDEGKSSSITRTVDPKAKAVTTLTCVDPSSAGGFVACTLKLTNQTGFKVVLESSSCDAHGNIFRVTAPESKTLTTDGCYEGPGKTLEFAGPYAAGTEISAEVVAPLLLNPPQLRVSGEYPTWTLTYEDGADTDFDDLKLTLTALN
ncbi:MAG: PKD domain-containing protein [Gemmatimonadales bacterium]